MNLIFDFDGTICDSAKSVVDIINNYFAKGNYKPISLQELEKTGAISLISTRQISAVQLSLLQAYVKTESAKLISNLNCFTHIQEVLQQLSLNHILGLITSNSEENISTFLKKKHLDKLFVFVNTDSDLFGKNQKIRKVMSKYNFKPEKTYYIGDETRDIEAAKKAGVKSVAVTWGYESKELLSQSHPDIIISKPEELLNL
jgi:phosphoglycolate phosphatase